MDESEIEHYVALAHDDLQAARDNLQLGHLRVAASRAYYAMFYAVTALLGSQAKDNGVANIKALSLHLARCS